MKPFRLAANSLTTWGCGFVMAAIVTPLHHPEYGGAFFACRDPEGHVWNLGSYDPWQP